MSKKVHEYTFPSSGITVKFHTVNALTVIDIRAAMEKQKPKPPMEEVELAGVMTLQPNEDDPDYIELLAMHDEDTNLKINRAYVSRARLKFDYEDWEQEVKEYRELIGDELKDPDEWIFVTRIAAMQSELQDFFAALSAASNPTPEAIQAAKASF